MRDSKAALRASVRASRAGTSLVEEDRARLAHVLDWLPTTPGVAATYLSITDEPDTRGLVDALVARGWEVRLPLLTREPDWARFAGWDQLRPAWRGIPEPTTPALGARSLAQCRVVVASCLLVDREGYRLGVGGGWYARARAHRGDATVLAFARDEECVERVPREPHDVPCDGWATGSGVTVVR